jgi:hypothetical protein
VTSSNAALLRISQPFFAPAAILVTAALLTRNGPDDLLAASVFLPFVILPIGAILSLWFNRGRVFLSLTSLFIAYMGYFVATRDHVDPFAGEAVLRDCHIHTA